MSLLNTLQPTSAARRFAVPWPEVVIVLVALALRLFMLELKPPHFDEGVNGFFVDQMAKGQPYHYDPTNFHGPLHFYPLFLMQTLFGHRLWALRLPTVLFSTLCVVVALGYRKYLGRTTCRLAACAMALSPAMTFYGRYAIHESFLLLALMIAVWGLIGLGRDGTRTALWATVLGIAGMILTKETYAIHVVALALAVPTLLLMEKATPSADDQRLPQTWTEEDLKTALAVGVGAIIFFYSGALLSWADLGGIVTTFQTWADTGTKQDGGHAKVWYYWFQLLRQYEWVALFGLAMSPLVLWPRTRRALRYLAIAGGGTLVAYSIIRYKTPWCIIVLIWPFFFVFGAVLERAMAWAPRWLPLGLAAALLGHSAYWSEQLNFALWRKPWPDPAAPAIDEDKTYVYVQTTTDVNKLMDPLRAMVARDKSNYHLHGVILLETEGDNHPLPWLLGDFTHIDLLYDKSPARETMDADFLFVQNPFVSDVEDRLRHAYFREKITLRASSELTGELYFDAEKFASLFPGRTPEYLPPAQPVPATPPPPAPELP